MMNKYEVGDYIRADNLFGVILAKNGKYDIYFTSGIFSPLIKHILNLKSTSLFENAY